MRTWIYKRSHTGDPHPRIGIFGYRDCEKTHRGRQYDAVLGIWGATNWDGDSSRAYKLSWIGTCIHRLIFDDELVQVLTSRIHDKLHEKWSWKGTHILAFEHFKYYANGYDLGAATNLVDRMYPVRTGGMMSPNLPERVQQEVDMLLKLAEDANPSACLNEFKELESVQHTLPKDEWINRVASLLDLTLT
jgi:hypothetical protein